MTKQSLIRAAAVASAKLLESIAILSDEYGISINPRFPPSEWEIDGISIAPTKSSQAAAALGKKGGQAKVAKGFSTMSPERRSEIAKAAAAKRWALAKLTS